MSFLFIHFFVIANFFCFKSKTFLEPSFTDSISVIPFADSAFRVFVLPWKNDAFQLLKQHLY